MKDNSFIIFIILLLIITISGILIGLSWTTTEAYTAKPKYDKLWGNLSLNMKDIIKKNKEIYYNSNITLRDYTDVVS